jgi:hypothetical protein
MITNTPLPGDRDRVVDPARGGYWSAGTVQSTHRARSKVKPPSVRNTVVSADPFSRNRVTNALTSGC